MTDRKPTAKGRRFAFFGAFACVPAGLDDSLLTGMVESAGGVVVPALAPGVDYLVVGSRRAAGKAAAIRRAADVGAHVLDEDAFLALVQPRRGRAAGPLDFPGLVGWLHGATDRGRVQRALTMLKTQALELYADVTDEHLVGVVRSQTQAGTLYASWLRPDGAYGCSSSEPLPCLGLQGRPCKHLLVLVVGLTRAGRLPPEVARAWLRATARKGPRTDNTLVAHAFLQYAGAQAGEIDWRPTQTMPEDFYAL
ncbi:MAG TPA: hypothetical protein VM734_33745 [Kofleriaceae bacterium]|nr:hypothetical protein [Kofleriaceae bacterium]